MSRVKFIKWHPSIEVKEYPETILWDKILSYTLNETGWLDAVEVLVGLGYYVGIHFDKKENLITIAVDTTWFRTR